MCGAVVGNQRGLVLDVMMVVGFVLFMVGNVDVDGAMVLAGICRVEYSGMIMVIVSSHR